LPEGDSAKGQTAIVELKCHECHSVTGVNFPAPVSTVASNIVLGGEVNRIQTHGELVTAIINPSHGFAQGFDKKLSKDGKTSPMPQINERMTVSQLIDIVAFLQTRYSYLEVSYRGKYCRPMRRARAYLRVI
jgi:hypothetical protein